MMQPIANMSTYSPYPLDLKTHSGARYHLVETYSVYGGALAISFINPKSLILVMREVVSVRMLSGFRSQWKNPFE